MTLLPRTIIPTWLQVIEVLHLLEDHELVGIEAFRKRDDEAAWSWAVSQRPPGVERGPRSGRSPWRHFAEGEKALSVRRLAPLWVASPDLWPISATELAHLALSDPGTRYRYQAADHVAQLLIRRPDAWGWLRSTVRLFDPDPLKKLADDADDLPWDRRPTIDVRASNIDAAHASASATTRCVRRTQEEISLMSCRYWKATRSFRKTLACNHVHGEMS